MPKLTADMAREISANADNVDAATDLIIERIETAARLGMHCVPFDAFLCSYVKNGVPYCTVDHVIEKLVMLGYAVDRSGNTVSW